MSFAWAGRNAVVTGAASGIGLALSEDLVARGARVLMADIAEPALAREAVRLGAVHRVCDVSDPAAVERLAAEAKSLFGTIDLAFANAGTILNGPLADAAPAEFDFIYAVNVRGAWSTIAAFARIMREQEHGGRISVTASEHSLGFQHGGAGFYTASKHAVLGLAEVFRAELPEKVRISAFCPGLVATNLADAARPADLPQPRESQRAFGRAVQAQGMAAADAARAGLDGVARGDFYIVTHANAHAAAERRFSEIDAAFAAQAPVGEGADRYEVNRIVAEMRAARRDS
ncbi:MAG: SDR family NAD(P)-dependent oxidoreductase [Novosphingobium sp.]|nr:SDR family NAD(P)-dependent oxidoreductase [Novosphingobium sp.]